MDTKTRGGIQIHNGRKTQGRKQRRRKEMGKANPVLQDILHKNIQRQP